MSSLQLPRIGAESAAPSSFWTCPAIAISCLSKVRLIAFPGLSPERKRRVTMIGLPHAACTIWRRRSINIVPKGSLRPAVFSRSQISKGLRRLRQKSEEHTSELQSLMRISYDVFCLNKKNKHHTTYTYNKA